VVDPGDPNRLFLATDVGVYATYNLGTWWYSLGTGLPIQPVFDLTFHSPTRTLVAATHGRSQWRLGPISLITGVGETPAPRAIVFSPPWPNPARGDIHGSVTLPTDESVRIDVFDVSGRHVRRLLDRRLTEGTHPFAWDGKDRLGRTTAKGTYFLRLQVAGRILGNQRVVRL
jgi:flagellar hook capping protein FlgD